MDAEQSSAAGARSTSEDFVWIELLPMALLTVVGATALPIESRSPATHLIVTSLDPGDFVLNVLLFLPLGIALADRSWYGVLAICGLLSVGVEVLQLGQAGRHAGPADVVANVAGGFLGSLLPPVRTALVQLESGRLGARWWLLAGVSLLAGAALLVAVTRPGTPNDFSNWDTTYRLAVSDELTRDRTWRGTLAAFAIFDRPIERDAIRDLARRELLPTQETAPDLLPPDPVALWTNPTPQQSSGFVTLSPQTSARVHRRLRSAGTMSLLAWFRVKDLQQSEAERIVTFSHDQYHRNFTLAQDRGAVQFRLRTPATGVNGIAPDTNTAEVLEPGEPYFVAATYDGFVARVFVDGELSGRENLAADAAAFPALQDSSLPLVLALCGGLLASSLICASRTSRHGVLWLLGGAGGLLVLAVISALGEPLVWPVHPAGPLWRAAPGLAGGLVMASGFAWAARAETGTK